MKVRLCIIINLLISIFRTAAQDDIVVRQIDSINSLPYHIRILTDESNQKRFLDILRQAQSINYPRGVAEAHANLALIYFYKGGRNAESLFHLFTAIDIFEQEHMLDAAANLYGLYGYGLRRKDMPKALSFMRKGIAMAEQNNAHFALLSMYDNYGVLQEDQGKFDSAHFYYSKALSMKKAANDTVGIPYSLNKLGILYQKLRKWSLAKSNLDQAYNLRLQLNDTVGIAENLRFYAKYYEALAQNDLAIIYYQRALELAIDAGYTEFVGKCHFELYQIYEKAKRYPEALQSFKQFYAYNDSINELQIQSRRAELETQFETQQKEKELLLHRAELAESRLSGQRKTHAIIISCSLLLLTLVISYLIYRLQKQKQRRLREESELREALAEAKTQQLLQEQRLKISRDLHDNIGAQLTFIISSIDNLCYFIKDNEPEIHNKLKYISEFTQGTIEELRDTIWAMNRELISLEDLKIRINNLINKAGDFIQHTHFRFYIDNAVAGVMLNSLEGMNLYRILQEAINNAIKHAKASTINISILAAQREGYRLQIEIDDEGSGFDISSATEGNGLANMKKRSQEINADFSIFSQKGRGTQIRILI